MNSQRNKSGKKSSNSYKYYNINKYDKNLIQGQRLFPPNYNKNINNNSKNTQFRYNYSSKNYNNINRDLNNYMNDYEKLSQQNKIPKIMGSDYTYQEYEEKKENIMKLFNNYLNLSKDDIFNDTNKIIDGLPDYPDDIMLKNDITSDDYVKRVKIKLAESSIKRNKKVSYKEESSEDEYIRKSNNKDKSLKNRDNIVDNNDKENKNEIKIEIHKEPKKEENEENKNLLKENNVIKEKESEKQNIVNNNEKKEKNLVNSDKKEKKIEKEKGEEKIGTNNSLKKEEKKENDDEAYEGEFEIIENTLNKKELKEEEKKDEENHLEDEDSDYGGFDQ